MKRWRDVLCVMSVALPFILAGGCVSGHASLGPFHEVGRGPTMDDRVRILWVNAHEEADRVRIQGAVQRQSHTSYPIRTHVDVVVTGADGRPLQRVWTREISVSRRVPGKGPDWTAFEVTLAGKLPAGSTIQVASHNGTHSAEPEPGEP